MVDVSEDWKAGGKNTSWSKSGQEAADLPRREVLNLKRESLVLFDIII